LRSRAAEASNVYAKLSGLDAGRPDRWSAADLRPWLEHALRWFGPARLMLGSDWPVSILRGGYQKVWNETCTAVAALTTPAERTLSSGTPPSRRIGSTSTTFLDDQQPPGLFWSGRASKPFPVDANVPGLAVQLDGWPRSRLFSNP
jgi:hypothetical protein